VTKLKVQKEISEKVSNQNLLTLKSKLIYL